MKAFPLGILAVLMLVSAAHADLLTASTIAAPQPSVVKVSAYILNIGNFNVATGSYTVDFYLDFKCTDNCSPGKFEFMNGRANSFDTLIDNSTEKFYRIQATLSDNIDLKQYPFDTHWLTIEIEDKTQTAEDQVYAADDSQAGIDPAVIVVGWDVKNWTQHVDEHAYAPYGETYSRYVFSVSIERAATTSIIKSFLPVFFMVIVALLSLLLTADKLTTRLTLNTSTLLAAVLFHVNVTASIPPVGYLTFADKFMMATYIIMISILASGILLMKYTDKKDQNMAQKIHDAALFYLPMMAFVIYLAVFVFL